MIETSIDVSTGCARKLRWLNREKVWVKGGEARANTLGVHNFTTHRENVLFNCL
jgi:hypothetical protein